MNIKSLFVTTIIAFAFVLLASGKAQCQSSYLPFDPASTSVLQQSKKKVFAHYMPNFPISTDNEDPSDDYYVRGFLNPDGEKGAHRAAGGLIRERPLPRAPINDPDWAIRDMETEVQLAEAAGIDGFTLNILSYIKQPKKWPRLKNLMIAAHNVDPNFKIMIMADGAVIKKSGTDGVTEAIEQLAQYPSAMRLADGRLVLSAFEPETQTVDWWQSEFQQLQAAGINVAFVPTFLHWPARESFAPISYGFGVWGSADAQATAKNLPYAEQTHKDVEIWMAPVRPQDERPKSATFWEALGSQNYRSMWMNAINNNTDWAQIVTWNDFGECTEIRPSTSIGYSFYDLTAYYVNWFKTGQQPVITRDVLYYFHRIQSTNATTNFEDPDEQIWKNRGPTPQADQIELLAFLTAPGHLSIKIAGHEFGKDAPAGITSFTVPLAVGLPEFSLTRSNQTIISFKSSHPISDSVTHWNMQYAGGSSARQGQ